MKCNLISAIQTRRKAWLGVAAPQRSVQPPQQEGLVWKQHMAGEYPVTPAMDAAHEVLSFMSRPKALTLRYPQPQQVL